MLIIHLLLVGMLVSAGDPNKGPSQKQQTFPWIKYSHQQDLYTGKHCLYVCLCNALLCRAILYSTRMYYNRAYYSTF